MELKEFTEFLVKSIVSDEDAVRVSEFKLEDDLIIEVLVSDVDRSLVIGKNGKMANSIRTLVQARAYIMNLGKVKLNGETYYANFNPLDSVKWNAVFLIPKDEVLSGFNKFVIFQLLALTSGFLLIIFGVRIIYKNIENHRLAYTCLLYTSPSPRDS